MATNASSSYGSGTKSIKIELVVLDVAMTIVITLFGIGGNALTIRVLRSNNLCKTSTAFYFTVLAAVDILVLVIGPAVKALSTIIYNDERHLRDAHQLLCKSQLFLNYSVSQISAWILVAVTIDRMIWVLWPFKARQVCTVRRAALVVLLIVTLICLVNSRHPWYSVLTGASTAANASLSQMHCTVNDTFIRHTYVTYVDPALVTIGPFLVMLVANLLIIRKLRQVRAKRERNLHKPASSGNKQDAGHLTKMLLCTSIFYLVSSLPYLVLMLVLKEHRKEFLKRAVVANIAYCVQIFCYNLFHLNYAIHFLLYCLAGPVFKAEAFRILRIRQTADTKAGTGTTAREAANKDYQLTSGTKTDDKEAAVELLETDNRVRLAVSSSE